MNMARLPPHVVTTAAARAFRENILTSGGSGDPLVLDKRFRGAEPKKDARCSGKV
jgi:Zn-dependent oligopeptidase